VVNRRYLNGKQFFVSWFRSGNSWSVSSIAYCGSLFNTKKVNSQKFGQIRAKFERIWAKGLRFGQIWLDLGKIKILHPQKHPISYEYVSNRTAWVCHCTYFFYKNNFIRTRGSFLLKIEEQIKNNPASAEVQSLKFSVNKTVASAAQLAKCILLHAFSRTIASSQLRENKQILNSWFYSWHNSIFD